MTGATHEQTGPRNNAPPPLADVGVSTARFAAVTPFSDWFGTCPTCMSLSAAFLALSLLIFGFGNTIDMPLLAAVGELASIPLGILFALHLAFYCARLAQRSAEPPSAQLGPPGNRQATFTVSNRGCCGGR